MEDLLYTAVMCGIESNLFCVKDLYVLVQINKNFYKLVSWKLKKYRILREKIQHRFAQSLYENALKGPIKFSRCKNLRIPFTFESSMIRSNIIIPARPFDDDNFYAFKDIGFFCTQPHDMCVRFSYGLAFIQDKFVKREEFVKTADGTYYVQVNLASRFNPCPVRLTQSFKFSIMVAIRPNRLINSPADYDAYIRSISDPTEKIPNTFLSPNIREHSIDPSNPALLIRPTTFAEKISAIINALNNNSNGRVAIAIIRSSPAEAESAGSSVGIDLLSSNETSHQMSTNYSLEEETDTSDDESSENDASENNASDDGTNASGIETTHVGTNVCDMCDSGCDAQRHQQTISDPNVSRERNDAHIDHMINLCMSLDEYDSQEKLTSMFGDEEIISKLPENYVPIHPHLDVRKGLFRLGSFMRSCIIRGALITYGIGDQNFVDFNSAMSIIDILRYPIWIKIQ